jgi:hypothetical protein
MDARTAALTIALGRAAIGATLLLAPRQVAEAWVGPGGTEPAAKLLARSVGARDLALGAGAAVALRQGGDARSWLLGGVLADIGDLAATLRSRDVVPGSSLAGVCALAGGAAVAGAWLAQRVP